LTGSATSTAEVDLEGRAPELTAAAALLDDPEDRITATERRDLLSAHAARPGAQNYGVSEQIRE
jgi:hypothetical protein